MEKILIVQLSRLGDLIQTLPLIKRLKQHKKNSHITLICIKELREIVQDTPLVDRLIDIPATEIVKLQQSCQLNPSKVDDILTIIPQLRETYDVVINITHDLVGSRICKIIQGQTKTGGINEYDKEIRYLGDWAKYLAAAVWHRSQNLFNLVDIYIGIGEIPHRPAQDYLLIPKEKQIAAYRLLRKEGYENRGKLIAFQMGSNKPHRAWPTENFALLANQLMKDSHVEILLLGTKKERALSDRFKCLCNVPVIDLVGKTSLTDLVAVLEQSNLLVSNDTGTIHIASAVKTRTLGLFFSSAYFGETAPYGDGNIIIQAELPCSPCLEKEVCEDLKCKDLLTVEAVKDVAKAMLEGKNDFRGFNFHNLSIYQSRFLGNGALIYIPIGSSSITDQYQIGFLSRIMWEATLGLEHDKAFLEEFMLRMKNLEGFKGKIIEYEKELLLLKELLSKGIKTAQEIQVGFKKRPINQAMIHSKANDIIKIEMDISNLDFLFGLIKDFHSLEMSDMDYVQYPKLAVYLIRKYRKLLGVTESFFSRLDTIKHYPTA